MWSNLFDKKYEPFAESTSGPARKTQFIEILVFLFLIVPSMSTSFLVSKVQSNLGFFTIAVSVILTDLSLLALILYFIWRNGETVYNLGYKSNNVVTEITIGVILFFPVVLAANYLNSAFRSIGFSSPSRSPSFFHAPGDWGIALAVVLVIVVAIVEETIFRGYLILRLYNTTRSTVMAMLFSAIIFSIGHGYEGLAGVSSIFILGVVLAIIYIWRASLIAPIIIHFLIDFSSIVIPSIINFKK